MTSCSYICIQQVFKTGISWSGRGVSSVVMLLGISWCARFLPTCPACVGYGTTTLINNVHIRKIWSFIQPRHEFSIIPMSEWQTPEWVLQSDWSQHYLTAEMMYLYIQPNEHLSCTWFRGVEFLQLCWNSTRLIINNRLVLLGNIERFLCLCGRHSCDFGSWWEINQKSRFVFNWKGKSGWSDIYFDSCRLTRAAGVYSNFYPTLGQNSSHRGLCLRELFLPPRLMRSLTLMVGHKYPQKAG